MRSREYGQFCGLARAAEVLGQRWTLLILRDLFVAPRRYSDLVAGLPGIPTNLLATRLKELEQDGLVTRQARTGADRSIVYALTARAEELAPAISALARWGAAGMRAPRENEVMTDASLVSALRVAAENGAVSSRRPLAFTIQVAGAVAQASLHDRTVTVEPGPHPAPDLVLNGGRGFRDLLAGALDADTARATGAVEIEGDPALLTTFAAAFVVPYSAAAEPDA
jgi:DNA-binding HxlR family transcriptional regulator